MTRCHQPHTHFHSGGGNEDTGITTLCAIADSSHVIALCKAGEGRLYCKQHLHVVLLGLKRIAAL